MKSKFCLYLLLFGFVVAGMFTSCIKKKCSRYLHFEGQAEILPRIDTFDLYDTFTLNVSFDYPVIDKNTGESFFIEDYNFLTTIMISRFDVVPSEFANLNFKALPVNGTIEHMNIHADSTISGGVPGSYEITFSNNLFQCKFIPLVPGNYHFSIFSFFDPYERYSDIELQCNSYLTVKYRMFENNAWDNNYHLILQSPNDSYNQISEEKYVEFGTYAFVVKE